MALRGSRFKNPRGQDGRRLEVLIRASIFHNSSRANRVRGQCRGFGDQVIQQAKHGDSAMDEEDRSYRGQHGVHTVYAFGGLLEI